MHSKHLSQTLLFYTLNFQEFSDRKMQKKPHTHSQHCTFSLEYVFWGGELIELTIRKRVREGGSENGQLLFLI